MDNQRKTTLLLSTDDLKIFIKEKYHQEVKSQSMFPGEIRSGSRAWPVMVVWKVLLDNKTVLLDLHGKETNIPVEQFYHAELNAAYILEDKTHIRLSEYGDERKAFLSRAEFNVKYSMVSPCLVERL